MKLIVATIQDQDSEAVLDALRTQKIGVTRIGSTGGFLQQGNTTLLIGIEDNEVDRAMGVLRRSCKRRTKFMPVAVGGSPVGEAFYNYLEVEVGGAVAFVLDVEQFEQI